MIEQRAGDVVCERRTGTRFRIQAPAVATLEGREIWAFTRDISTSAVYLLTEEEEGRPSVGEQLSFVIKIPPSISFANPCFIKGRGRTIRIDDLGGKELGVAVEILDYDIKRGEDG